MKLVLGNQKCATTKVQENKEELDFYTHKLDTYKFLVYALNILGENKSLKEKYRSSCGSLL
jgi:hypothetical protein